MPENDFDAFRKDTLKNVAIEETNSGIFAGKWYPKAGESKYDSISPVDGKHNATVFLATKEQYEEVVRHSQKAFDEWSKIPAPKRGEIIKTIGDELAKKKKDLGALVTLEAGKTTSEGEGEIQEMIDVAYFAAGLSRQLYGLTMASERPDHRLYEQWQPLGPIAVISAFNFPSSVWSWNAMVAAVCGDTVVWKPSTKASLAAVGVMKVISSVLDREGAPQIFSLVASRGSEGGEWISNDPRLKLVSFTGSTKTGRTIYENVARRIGRATLELGGNNCSIVSDRADMKLALKGVAFGALATAGQRCTSTRRVVVHEKIYNEFLAKLKDIYASVKIGNPRSNGVLVGPLIDDGAISTYEKAIAEAVKEGGKLVIGGKRIQVPGLEKGFYVNPAIIEANPGMEITKQETFGPLLYIFKYRTIEEALEIHNAVPQGLSSAIFTTDMREEEYFLSARGSDCGLANVNTSTAGAEIGGAFGGEKETGAGRESGSDSWKLYMRRQTVTINYGRDLPLAQGVKFDV